MRLNRWRWIATLNDGSIIEQSPEPAAFLGDLDIAKVEHFTVKRLSKSFSLDLNTRQFFTGEKVIATAILSQQKPKFYCFRRVTVHQDGGEEKKIIFGFKDGKTSYGLTIDESGNWSPHSGD